MQFGWSDGTLGSLDPHWNRQNSVPRKQERGKVGQERSLQYDPHYLILSPLVTGSINIDRAKQKQPLAKVVLKEFVHARAALPKSPQFNLWLTCKTRGEELRERTSSERSTRRSASRDIKKTHPLFESVCGSKTPVAQCAGTVNTSLLLYRV